MHCVYVLVSVTAIVVFLILYMMVMSPAISTGYTITCVYLGGIIQRFLPFLVIPILGTLFSRASCDWDTVFLHTCYPWTVSVTSCVTSWTLKWLDRSIPKVHIYIYSRNAPSNNANWNKTKHKPKQLGSGHFIALHSSFHKRGTILRSTTVLVAPTLDNTSLPFPYTPYATFEIAKQRQYQDQYRWISLL